MTEDFFRIIVAVAIAVATLAFVIQAGVAIELYRRSKNFLDDVKPVLARAGTVFTAANQILDDARPEMKEFTADTAAFAKSGREQVQRLGNLLHDASERVRTRLEQIDHTVESTVERVKRVEDTVERALMKPVKEANGWAAGISAAVSTVVYRFRKSGTC